MSGTVLVVEDDANLRYFVSTVLRGAGFDPVSAVRAEDALSLLDGVPCDLAVMDVRLPGMSGMNALGEISRRRPDLPVVIMTACDAVTETSALERGATSFLRKPFSAEQLLDGVRKALACGGTKGASPRKAVR